MGRASSSLLGLDTGGPSGPLRNSVRASPQGTECQGPVGAAGGSGEAASGPQGSSPGPLPAPSSILLAWVEPTTLKLETCSQAALAQGAQCQKMVAVS